MENYYTDIESVQNALWMKTGLVINSLHNEEISQLKHNLMQQKEVTFDVTDMNNTLFKTIRVRATDNSMLVFIPQKNNKEEAYAEELIDCTDELIKINVARFGKVYASYVVGNLFKDLKTTFYKYNEQAQGLPMREADLVYINRYMECQDKANQLWNLVDYMKSNCSIKFEFVNNVIQLANDEQPQTID